MEPSIHSLSKKIFNFFFFFWLLTKLKFFLKKIIGKLDTYEFETSNKNKKGVFKMKYELYKQMICLLHIWQQRIRRALQNQSFDSFV